MFKIFVINPGSTSTKTAIFWDEKEYKSQTIHHSPNELLSFSSIIDQLDFRYKALCDFLQQNGIEINCLDVVVARGGLLRPIPSGSYLVGDKMIADLKSAKYGEHASNLGAILASKFIQGTDKPAIIVDPVVVDEMNDIARFSGLPEISRKSIFHALNQKAAARKAAQQLGAKYERLNLIVAHLGGGISVGAHKKGQVVDVSNALDGEGPFSPERTGGLPVGDLARLCYSGKYTQNEISLMIKGRGGMVAYLGTNDMRKVEDAINHGDKKARMVLDAMAYQVAKQIASYGAVFKGKVDAIVLTGGLMYFNLLVELIKERCDFLAQIIVFEGEMEMEALALSGQAFLQKKIEPKRY
jgi:butyrate kinase